MRSIGREALARPGDWLGGPDTGGQRRETRRIAALEDLAATLGDLKGAFAKAGQFAAVRHDLLPAAALDALARLRDQVPPLPGCVIREQVETELGAPLDRLFSRFEPEPVGAASIAQVHRAWLADGRAVAVKVQYPWLAWSLPADVALLRLAFGALRRLRGLARVDTERVFDEFASGLAEEIDFRREAEVAGEIAGNLAQDDRIVVPEVIASHSSERVLTMTWHPGVSVTDHAALQRLGVVPTEIVEILTHAYARQIFVDGLFHADPHPGNLFVLDEPASGSGPRVVFVDFGLCKRLQPDLRRELRQGIHALLRSDVEAFLDGMERLDAVAPGAREPVRAAVAGIFERLRGEGSGPLGLGAGRVLALKDEAKVLLQETPGLHLPNDLLLYAKTLSYLFTLTHEIAPQQDPMKIAVPYLLRFLAARDD